MTTPAGPARGGGLLAGRNRRLLIGGGAVVAVVIVALWKRGKSAAAGTAGTGYTSTGATMTGTATPYTYGGSFSDSGEYTTQMQAIQQQLAQLTALENPPGNPAVSGGRRPGQPMPNTVPPAAAVSPLGGSYSGPNLRGLTAGQVAMRLQGSPWYVNNQSGNLAGKVVSFTPYSNGSINLGYN